MSEFTGEIMSKSHRIFLIACLAAGSLALAGCQDVDPAGEWTRSDRFDGGNYPGEHTRSDLDAGTGPAGDARSGADTASDPDRAAVDAENRARFGQDTGVNTGAGTDRDRAADAPGSSGGRSGGGTGSGGTGR